MCDGFLGCALLITGAVWLVSLVVMFGLLGFTTWMNCRDLADRNQREHEE